jgi:DNA-binding LacI/PurR family transcriptional regulator
MVNNSDSPTLQAIASQAGVSLSTVSNVLNRGRVGQRSDAQRNAKRIRKIADRLGYRPNMAARAIKARRFNAVGLLASTNPQLSIYQHFMKGLTAGCRERDLPLSVGEVVDQELEDDGRVPLLLREWSVDGLLIAYNYGFPARLAEIVKQQRVPAIWLNARRDSDCVYPDDAGAARKATELLLSAGHRRIAYVQTYGERHSSDFDRRRGVREAMADAGLAPVELYPPLTEPVRLSKLAADLRVVLASPDRPTAFVCYGADHGLTVCHTALEVGLRTPEDLSIVCSSARHVDQIGRPLTSMRVDARTIGVRAVDLLVEKIAQPDEVIPPVVVPLKVAHPQASVAPPPVNV